MTDRDDGGNRINALAEDVLDITRNRLLVNLRYMDTALTFHDRRTAQGTFATDGRALLYDPVYVLKSYDGSRNALARLYLHTVLHCVFMHPFSGRGRDKDRWDLACDIAAESVVLELDLPCARTDDDARRLDAVRKIRRECGFLTAEKIYRALEKGGLSLARTGEDTASLKKLFVADDHMLWHDEETPEGDATAALSEPLMPGDDIDAASEWKKIAEKIEMEVETFAKVKGRYASSLVQNLRAVNRERYDYDEFLRRFSSLNEAVKVSDDEFDYIYYNYGLTHYRNMPLIEPLEYREDRRIHDFVIAIDTSGSVAGEEVQAFLQKTYNILKSRESFDNRVNVHIVQCDAKIQSDTVITQSADLDRYMENMEIRGLGGTDFRPVFEYVDRLAADGEFSDLKGLIYFTDGLGTYPSAKPAYKTAFVFIERGYNVPEVPVWAIKAVLQPEEI